jgi:NADPH-dependent 2,4-dienoyl-CoA reductase/sulfur reductase-like enzyme
MTDTPNDLYAARALDRTTDVSAFRLDGRVAVVIGGTGVLCGNIAETLARAGATTVLVGRDQRPMPSLLVCAQMVFRDRSSNATLRHENSFVPLSSGL